MKSKVKKWLKIAQVAVLTALVVLSFIMSTFGYRRFHVDESTKVIVAAVILVIMYSLIISEVMNRNLAALIGAAMSIAAHDCLVDYVTVEEIIQWEDLETLSLLFGMMIIVSILSSSGLFDYIAVWCYKKYTGRFWSLVIVLSIITALMSALLDNVSTMLLLSPTLIKISDLEDLDPRYLLMIMSISSNIGGCATPVGDPPNLIIIGDDLSASLNINFGNFVAYCTPGTVLAMISMLVYVKFKYKSRDSFCFKNEGDKNVPRCEESQAGRTNSKIIAIDRTSLVRQQIMDEIEVLNEFTHKLESVNSNLSSATRKLKLNLSQQVETYETLMEKNQLQAQPPDRRNSIYLEMQVISSQQRPVQNDSTITSKPILIQSLAVLVITVLLFFAQSIPESRLTLGWISLFAALTLLVLSSTTKLYANDDDRRPPNELTLHKNQAETNEESKSAEDEAEDSFELAITKIEWSSLIFFFALFIVMEVMSKLGLILFIGQRITKLIDLLPVGKGRSIGAITIILWSSGIASACIDNIPYTSMMIKVLSTMYEEAYRAGGIDGAIMVKPLVFALVFGACLGGNGTLIGASANLVTAGISNKAGFPITFNSFFKFASPLTIATLAVANIYLVFVFVVFGLG